MEATRKMALKEGRDCQGCDMSLESAEGAQGSISTETGRHGPAEKRLKFYAMKLPVPVKCDFHFPEEVWEIILNMLTEDEDRTNCCRAFPLFDKLLTKSKPVWMFKQILPFVYDDDYLDVCDMLTSRRVCKQWCEDIEHYTENGGFQFIPQNFYTFESTEDIDDFARTFAGHSRNPFIHRIVCIDGLENPDTEFLNKLLNLFSTFGKYVGWLEFFWSWNNPREDAYLFFQQILTKTPNLKTLTMWGEIEMTSPDEIAANPLPSLPAVTSLDMWTTRTEDFFIHSLVLQYALQLQSITMASGSSDQVFCHELPNLTELEVLAILNDQELEKLLRLTSPLKSLELTLSGPSPYDDDNSKYSEDPSAFSVSTLLRIFQHFSLLEKVYIDISWNIDTQFDISQVKNSTVRTLGIIVPIFRKGNRLPVSCNFLQAFGALEELTIELYLPRETFLGRNEGEAEVQLYKILEDGQVYESNIWRLIPSLKTIEIKYDCYDEKIVGNRRGFADHQAK